MDINVATALVGAFAGAAIAGLFSVFAGALQSNREHDRWVRESRFDAYSDFLVAIDAWSIAATTDWVEATFTSKEAIAKNRDHTHRLEVELSRAQSRVVLIGPDVVRTAAEDYQLSMVERAELARSVTRVDEVHHLEALLEVKALQQKRGLLLGFMNFAIGIGPRRRFKAKFRRVE